MKERALKSAQKLGFITKTIIERNEFEYKYKELLETVKKGTFKEWVQIVLTAQNQLEELENLRKENSELKKELREERKNR